MGDPIEANAVAHVYGEGREAGRPLLMGSVKTNIGHLESAAGVAGLIKAALVVKRGVIPKHLHFHEPNRSIDWANMPLKVTSSMMDWPDREGRPRIAGVNCFGISGTNTHLVVEGYRTAGERPARQLTPVGAPCPATGSLPGGVPDSAAGKTVPETEAMPVAQPRRTRLLPLSGKSEVALRELAGRYLSWLDERDGESADRVAGVVDEANAASSGVGVSVSADNGTHQVVSGPTDEIAAISERLEAEGIRVRRLNTAKAFHSALVEPVLDALEASLDDVTVAPPSLTVVSRASEFESVSALGFTKNSLSHQLRGPGHGPEEQAHVADKLGEFASLLKTVRAPLGHPGRLLGHLVEVRVFRAGPVQGRIQEEPPGKLAGSTGAEGG